MNIPAGVDSQKVVQIVGDEAKGMWEQFGAIILSEPMIGEVETARGGGWSFLGSSGKFESDASFMAGFGA